MKKSSVCRAVGNYFVVSSQNDDGSPKENSKKIGAKNLLRAIPIFDCFNVKCKTILDLA